MSESLPSSRSEVQFNVPVNRLQQPDMPVLTGMADAFQRGALDVQTLFKSASMGSDLKRQKAEDEVRVTKAKSELESAPAEQAVRIAKLESELADIKNKELNRPKVEAFKSAEADIAIANQTARKLAAANFSNGVEPDALTLVQAWESNFKNEAIPYRAEQGQREFLDYNKMRERLAPIQKRDAEQAAQGPASALNTASNIKQAAESGRPLYHADGKAKTTFELDSDRVKDFAALRDTGTPLTERQKIDQRDVLDRNLQLLADMEQASTIIAKDTATGPFIGTLPGQAAAWALAATRIDPTIRDDQKKLTMFANWKVAEGTQLLKGALSEKELKFIEQTVPELSSSKLVWEQYLAPRIKMLKAANDRMVRGGKVPAPGEADLTDGLESLPMATQPSSNVGVPSSRPPSPIPDGQPGSTKENPAKAASADEYAKLAHGAWYWNAKHKMSLQKP
jgi:hypothetical protein